MQATTGRKETSDNPCEVSANPPTTPRDRQRQKRGFHEGSAGRSGAIAPRDWDMDRPCLKLVKESEPM
ncbi:hypothetical protein GJ744_004837 [Endocarpon pusillum]|uniref:Uncharacterized protein n=1 Tax=Endocarpon pusillum TaxID=364733 RepID=A0A8H7E6N1_9EURO|nr:hypothetical protein GJ744_004837 [Endocarpon pusillum]